MNLYLGLYENRVCGRSTVVPYHSRPDVTWYYPTIDGHCFQDPTPDRRCFQDPTPDGHCFQDPTPDRRCFQDPTPDGHGFRMRRTSEFAGAEWSHSLSINTSTRQNASGTDPLAATCSNSLRKRSRSVTVVESNELLSRIPRTKPACIQARNKIQQHRYNTRGDTIHTTVAASTLAALNSSCDDQQRQQ